MIDAPPAIVIEHDAGGRLGEWLERVSRYKKGDMRVEIRGECDSSCTIVTSMPSNKICVGPKAVLGFHAPVQQFPGRAPTATGGEFYGSHVMMVAYPDNVRQWVTDNGGLTEKIIYLHGPELQAMFPRCR